MQYKKFFSILAIVVCVCTLFGTVRAEEQTDSGITANETTTAVTELPVTTVKKPTVGFRDMRLAAETEFLRLYICEQTAEIALENKADNRILWSNPQEEYAQADLSDNIVSEIGSQVVLKYLNASQVAGTYTSKMDCVDKGQFSICTIDGGIRVDMTIGEVEQESLLPMVINRQAFEDDILALIENTKDRSRLKVFYRLLSRDIMSDSEYAKQVALYPALEKQDLYVFRGGSDVEIRLLNSILQAINFTSEQLEEVHKQVGYEQNQTTSKALPTFTLALEYLLDDDSFVCRLDASKIKFEDSQFILSSVSLLPYFGAQDIRTIAGQLFVPDGSGALISFGPDVPLHKQNNISGDVYGSDMAITTNAFYGKKNNYYMPVFGIKAENTGFVAVLEDGAAVAAIDSFTSDGVNPYAGTSVRYGFQSSDNITKDTLRYDSNRYEGLCQIRYFPLSAGMDDYVAMATRYRQYLIDSGIFNDTVKASTPPLYLETLGTFKSMDKILGLNQEITLPLSTFEDAQNMLKGFVSAGVSNLQLRYVGWNNGGLQYGAPSRLKVEKKLGGKSGLLELIEYTKEAGIGLYPDADFRFVRKDSLFDGFTVNNDAVRQLDGTNALHMQVNVATLENNKKTAEYIITPSRLSYFTDTFLKRYSKLGISGLSVGSLGNSQTAEYKSQRATDMCEGLVYTQAALERLAGVGSLMTQGGNAYTWAYVDHVVAAPTENSRFVLESKSVPFMAIVLHGYREYAGEVANLQTDFREAVLKAAETGSGLYVTLAVQNLIKLGSTNYSDYYSIDYNYWYEQVVAAMTELRQVLAGTCGMTITGHTEVTDDVFATTFGDKIVVYVNYGDEAQMVNGQTIPGKGMVAVHEN